LTQNRKSRPGISRESGVGCGLLKAERRTGDMLKKGHSEDESAREKIPH
jgi:hypothetical protein